YFHGRCTPRFCFGCSSEMNQRTVCVTGAGGFIGSWLVKLLLSRGYTVKGAVRNPEDSKYEHLRALEGASASKNLRLVKADILDYDSLVAVIRGCDGVFHMACLISEDLEQVMDPAVKGTANVLDASAECGVKRLVLTSSIGAVYMDPKRDPHLVVDEDCWSDLDYCIQTKNWYCYAKTVAEKAAWKRAEERDLDMVVVNPCLVLGPLLHSFINASTSHITKYLTGTVKTYSNLTQAYVDVRDVAEAHILVYETPSACGRYLCAESSIHRAELVQLLSQILPHYPIPS
ncbi:hypothetical protein KI387_037143, partial [Taxus chinensis]